MIAMVELPGKNQHLGIRQTRSSTEDSNLPAEELSKSSAKLDLKGSLVSKKDGYPPKSVKTSSLGGSEDGLSSDLDTHKNHSPNSFAVKGVRNLRCCR